MTTRGKPMLFSGPMVRALIDGRKTQTRRVLKPQPDYRGGAGDYIDPEEWGWEDEDGYHVSVLDIAPNGYRIGDRLWVRETWTAQMDHGWSIADARSRMHNEHILYRADGNDSIDGWWPSIHMPREFSRLTLIVTGVRVQRLQEISEADAVAEGCPCQTDDDLSGMEARGWFRDLWDSLNAKRAPWDSNPWVVALTFEAHRCNIDQTEAPQ